MVLSSAAEADQEARFLHKEQWNASNSSGTCAMSRFVGTVSDGVSVSFFFSSNEGETPKGLRVSVGGMRDVWPARIELVGDPAARSFEIGSDPTVLPLLIGESAEAVLAHLQSGGEILVHYRSSTGDTARAMFGTEGFRQSNAMFAACIKEMSPNNALEQTLGDGAREGISVGGPADVSDMRRPWRTRWTTISKP
jgi:hypothetical protein